MHSRSRRASIRDKPGYHALAACGASCSRDEGIFKNIRYCLALSGSLSFMIDSDYLFHLVRELPKLAARCSQLESHVFPHQLTALLRPAPSRTAWLFCPNYRAFADKHRESHQTLHKPILTAVTKQFFSNYKQAQHQYLKHLLLMMDL